MRPSASVVCRAIMEDVTTNLMCVNVSPTGGLLGTAAYTRDLVSTAPLQEGPVRQALPRASANQV